MKHLILQGSKRQDEALSSSVDISWEYNPLLNEVDFSDEILHEKY